MSKKLTRTEKSENLLKKYISKIPIQHFDGSISYLKVVSLYYIEDCKGPIKYLITTIDIKMKNIKYFIATVELENRDVVIINSFDKEEVDIIKTLPTENTIEVLYGK